MDLTVCKSAFFTSRFPLVRFFLLSFLSHNKLLVDIRVMVSIELTDMGAVGPVLVVDSSPSDFHLINTSPSFECTVLEDKPTSNTEIVSLLKATILDVVLDSKIGFSCKFDVVNLGSIGVGSSLSNKIKSVLTVFSLEVKLFMVEFVVFRKELGNLFAVEDHSESVAVLIPETISGSPIKG